MVDNYTREAGVRTLEQRVAARVPPRGRRSPRRRRVRHVRSDDVEKCSGRRSTKRSGRAHAPTPASRRALSWTPAGGDLMFIESMRMPGKGKVHLTGQMGDVMKESAAAAFTYVRARASEASGSTPTSSRRSTCTCTFPQGAIPKDGPSAGIAILVSLRVDAHRHQGAARRGDDGRDHPARQRAARGRRQGQVPRRPSRRRQARIMPKLNEPDLDEVPKEIRDALHVHLISHVDEALGIALERMPLRPNAPWPAMPTPELSSRRSRAPTLASLTIAGQRASRCARAGVVRPSARVRASARRARWRSRCCFRPGRAALGARTRRRCTRTTKVRTGSAAWRCRRASWLGAGDARRAARAQRAARQDLRPLARTLFLGAGPMGERQPRRQSRRGLGSLVSKSPVGHGRWLVLPLLAIGAPSTTSSPRQASLRSATFSAISPALFTTGASMFPMPGSAIARWAWWLGLGLCGLFVGAREPRIVVAQSPAPCDVTRCLRAFVLAAALPWHWLVCRRDANESGTPRAAPFIAHKLGRSSIEGTRCRRRGAPRARHRRSACASPRTANSVSRSSSAPSGVQETRA